MTGLGVSRRSRSQRHRELLRRTGLSGPLRALDITPCGRRCTISDAVSTIRTCRWTNEPPAPIFVPGSPRVVRHDPHQRSIRIRVANPWRKSPSLGVAVVSKTAPERLANFQNGSQGSASACDSGSLPIPTATARTGTPSLVLWLLLGLPRPISMCDFRGMEQQLTAELPPLGCSHADIPCRDSIIPFGKSPRGRIGRSRVQYIMGRARQSSVSEHGERSCGGSRHRTEGKSTTRTAVLRLSDDEASAALTRAHRAGIF
jgi:hypothetical protein